VTALYIGGGALVLGMVLWVVGRLSKPAAMNRVSDAWLDSHKYDRRQHRQD